ncbi:MAG TPA: hypothetical protein DEA55_11930 [Rhodospirillaceae bacterium]|nr:hypothetical protein [Rhodospirillaceae bacterium]
MPGKNGKSHNGYNGNGYNGASLQHYFIAVANDGCMSASKKACIAEKDILTVGGEQIRIKQYGVIARVHFSLPSGLVRELTDKGHTVHVDHEPYLAY